MSDTFDQFQYGLERIITLSLGEHDHLLVGGERWNDPPKLRPEINVWVHRSCKQKVWARPGLGILNLYFDRQEDAALFKLFHL